MSDFPHSVPTPDGPSPSPDPEVDVRELADVPAVEVITRSIVMLMSSAAEKLGLADDAGAADRLDLDEARRLITALAGLVTASAPDLGLHAGPVRDGLKSLQLAFREASSVPDEPGRGPGEKSTGTIG